MKRGMRLFPEASEMNPRRLLSPSVLLIVLSNLIPFAGVLYWGWDIFVLLMLFWLETAVFAFWTMAAILLGSGDTDAQKTGFGGRVGIVLFFTLHSGIFMLVHFFFLWALFSGNWQQEIHSPADFVRKIVIGSGIWLPLLISFIGHGVSMIAWGRGAPQTATAPVVPGSKTAHDGGKSGEAVGQLYGRVVVLHVVILLGAFLSQSFGSMAPFLLLILLKTLVDVGFHISAQKNRSARKPVSP